MINILKNKVILVFGFITFVLLFILHQKVQLYGDDFFYGCFAQQNLLELIKTIIIMYNNVNGRFISNLLPSLILYFDINLWRTINPLLIISLIFLAYKIVVKKKNNITIFIIITALFFLLDILITQESIYWIAGCFNYLVPIIFMLLNVFVVIKILNNEFKNKYIIVLTAFLAGMSVEQTAIISVGIMILLFIYQFFIMHKKIPFEFKLNLVVVIIGALLMILAPGNFLRYTSTVVIVNPDKFSMIINNFKLVYKLLFLFGPIQWLNFVVLLTTSLGLISLTKLNKFKKIGYIQGILGILASIIYFVQIYYSNISISKMILLDNEVQILLLGFITIVYFINILTYTLIKLIKDHNPMFFIFLLTGYGIQLFMTFSPIMGYRTILVTIVLLWIIVANIMFELLELIKNKKISYFINTGISIACIITIILNYSNVYNGYSITSAVIEKNLKIISIAKSNNFIDVNEVILEKVTSENYHWNMPYISKDYMDLYRGYYKIPKNVEIIFRDKENVK